MLHLPILITDNLSSRTDVQTDVQNVPVDTFNGTLKLRLSLIYQRVTLDDGEYLVRLRGLEPPRIIHPQRPQRCASTGSATAAQIY